MKLSKEKQQECVVKLCIDREKNRIKHACKRYFVGWATSLKKNYTSV